MAEKVTKITINDECIACEACVAAAPDVLEMDGEMAVVKAEVNNPEGLATHSESIIQAAEECPTESIEYETA